MRDLKFVFLFNSPCTSVLNGVELYFAEFKRVFKCLLKDKNKKLKEQEMLSLAAQAIFKMDNRHIRG